MEEFVKEMVEEYNKLLDRKERLFEFTQSDEFKVLNDDVQLHMLHQLNAMELYYYHLDKSLSFYFKEENKYKDKIYKAIDDENLFLNSIKDFLEKTFKVTVHCGVMLNMSNLVLEWYDYVFNIYDLDDNKISNFRMKTILRFEDSDFYRELAWNREELLKSLFFSKDMNTKYSKVISMETLKKKYLRR